LYGLKDSELALKGRVWKVYGIDGDEGRRRAREIRTEIRRDLGKGGNSADLTMGNSECRSGDWPLDCQTSVCHLDSKGMVVLCEN